MPDLGGRSQSGCSWLMTSYAVDAEVALISAFVMRVEDDFCPLLPVPAPVPPVVAHPPAVSRNAIVMEARRWLRRMRISLKGIVDRVFQGRRSAECYNNVGTVPLQRRGASAGWGAWGCAPGRARCLDRACNGPQTWV